MHVCDYDTVKGNKSKYGTVRKNNMMTDNVQYRRMLSYVSSRTYFANNVFVLFLFWIFFSLKTKMPDSRKLRSCHVSQLASTPLTCAFAQKKPAVTYTHRSFRPFVRPSVRPLRIIRVPHIGYRTTTTKKKLKSWHHG